MDSTHKKTTIQKRLLYKYNLTCHINVIPLKNREVIDEVTPTSSV